MRNLTDLRETLETHAGEAPDGTDLVPRARAGAVRIRRRRRALQGAAAAAAVAAVVVAAPLAVRPSPGGIPSGAESAPYRTPSRLSVGVVPGSDFTVTIRGSDGSRQFAQVRSSADVRADRPGVPGRNSGADVLAYDPGTFDPTALRRGERVTVSGREGWYVPNLTTGGSVPGQVYRLTSDGPAVGWQDGSGVWVVVRRHSVGPETRSELVEVAEDIRLDPPHEARAPFRFGWVPDGLPVTYVQLADDPARDLYAQFGFGAAVPPEAGDPPVAVVPLMVRAVPSTNPDSWIRADLPAPTPIGGHDTWYLPRPNDLFVGPETGADLLVDAGSCIVYLQVRDRTQVNRAELTRMVENATFGSCTDPAGWLPPVG